MIALGNATTTITATLAGAKNTNDADVTCFFTDEPSALTGVAVAVMDKQQSNTNGATPVTILSAGAAGVGFRRRLKSMTLYNADVAAITVSIKIVDSAGPTTTVLQKVTLQTLEQLTYEEGYGFQAFDVNGALKSQAQTTSAATSTAQAAGSQASSMASIALLGSSQASSMAALVPASVSSNASLGVLGSAQSSSLLTRWSTTISKTSSSFSF